MTSLSDLPLGFFVDAFAAGGSTYPSGYYGPDVSFQTSKLYYSALLICYMTDHLTYLMFCSFRSYSIVHDPHNPYDHHPLLILEVALMVVGPVAEGVVVMGLVATTIRLKV